MMIGTMTLDVMLLKERRVLVTLTFQKLEISKLQLGNTSL